MLQVTWVKCPRHYDLNTKIVKLWPVVLCFGDFGLFCLLLGPREPSAKDTKAKSKHSSRKEASTLSMKRGYTGDYVEKYCLGFRV